MIRLVALALALVLAGCSAPGPPPGPAEPPLPDWAIPAAPDVAGSQLVTDLEAFVTRFPHRTHDTADHRGAREHLVQAFQATGLELWRQTYTSDGFAHENVCALKLGERDPEAWVVVGAHYDMISADEGRGGAGYNVTQGAYDNGAGTWMMMGLARAFADVPTYVSVLFCAFDGEERGARGSGKVFKAMDEEEGFPYPVRAFRSMINLDMYGICPPVRVPIRVLNNHEFLGVLVDLERRAMDIPDELYEGRHAPRDRGSDHDHWFIAGVPSLTFDSHFVDTAVPTPFEAPAGSGVSLTYLFWHQGDTMDTMRLSAGSDELLRAGFETCADLAARALGIVALRPDIQRIDL